MNATEIIARLIDSKAINGDGMVSWGLDTDNLSTE
jgi:hypothetical protein